MPKNNFEHMIGKKDRVKGVMNRFYTSGGTHAVERRGGDRNSCNYEARRLSIHWFIETFHVQEGHYCRSKTKRMYLPAELNIRKLWRMYNVERGPDLQVTHGFFRKICCTDYNIGYGSPRTDMFYVYLLPRAEKVETDSTKKQLL